MKNAHLRLSQYSPSAFVWMCKNYIGEEVIRMIRGHDASIRKRVTCKDDKVKLSK